MIGFLGCFERRILSSSLSYSLSDNKSSWSPLGGEGKVFTPLFSGGKEGKEGRGSPLDWGGSEGRGTPLDDWGGSEGKGTPLDRDGNEGRGITSPLAWDCREGKEIVEKGTGTPCGGNEGRGVVGNETASPSKIVPLDQPQRDYINLISLSTPRSWTNLTFNTSILDQPLTTPRSWTIHTQATVRLS